MALHWAIQVCVDAKTVAQLEIVVGPASQTVDPYEAT
jgi:hypothetical protein